MLGMSVDKSRNRQRPLFGCVMVVAIAIGIAVTVRADDGDTSPGVEHLRIPDMPSGGQVSDLIIDSDGTVWVVGGSKVYCLTDIGFEEPASGRLRARSYLFGFFGGPERGAYVSQRGSSEHEGLLYKLENHVATLVTSFYYGTDSERPGLYVSHDGTLFNWDDRFLARFDGQDWQRVEAKLSRSQTIVLDYGVTVYFYFNSHLYRADGTGLSETTSPEFLDVRIGQDRVLGARWGKDKAVLVDGVRGGKLLVFEPATGKTVDVTVELPGSPELRFYDAFGTRNGDVWLATVVEGRPKSTFFALSTDGQFAEVEAMSAIRWPNARYWQYPDCILESSRGDFFFGLKDDGLAVIQDGAAARWGWKHGFPQGVHHIHEDLEGRVLFAIQDEVVRVALGADPPIVEAANDWEQIALLRRDIWNDGAGGLMMFRNDHPEALSRWDGQAWSHQELPFDRSHIGRAILDDRGHLLIQRSAYPDGCYDIGPSTVVHYENVEAMLVAAVSHGARQFRSHEYAGIVVGPGGQIWFAYKNYQNAFLYDGTRWDRIAFSKQIRYVVPSVAHGVMIQAWKKWYRYDRGQLVEVVPERTENRALLLGDDWTQPYERALVEAQSGAFLAVWRGGPNILRLLHDLDAFERAIDDGTMSVSPLGTPLPNYTTAARSVLSGGTWISGPEGSSPPSRLFGGELLTLDPNSTPLAGKIFLRFDEDAAGNMWFVMRSASGESSYSAFMARQAALELTTATPHSQSCGRELEVEVNLTPTGLTGNDRLFVRLNGGAWTPVRGQPGKCMLRFPASGEYRCEITGFRFLGRIRNNLEFRVRATVPLPDTVLTASTTDAVRVEAFEWQPPVSIRKTCEEASVRLRWRFLDGDWQTAEAGSQLNFADLLPGPYTIELAAEEDEFWRDDTPLRIELVYAPDYDRIFSNFLRDLRAEQPALRQAALQNLQRYGDRHLPLLEEALREAEEAAAIAGPLRRIVRDLKRRQNKSDVVAEAGTAHTTFIARTIQLVIVPVVGRLVLGWTIHPNRLRSVYIDSP